MSDNSFGSVIQDLYGVVSNDISDAKREINNRINEEIQSINAQDNAISLTPIKESNELGKFINKKDNLDDIITVGNYYCANATNNINNIIQESLPESLRGNCSFRLTVMYPMDDSTIEQIIIGKVNDCIIIATRSRNIKANEQWTEWNNVFDESNAEATLEQLDKYGIHLNVDIGSVKTISATSKQHYDVNNLVPSDETNVGDYFASGTVAKYVDNIPITGETNSFRLFNTCDYKAGTSFAGHQIIIYNTDANPAYIRYYYNGTWYGWHKIMNDLENDHLLQLDSTKYVNKLIKPEGGALINIGISTYNVGNWYIGTADEATANINPTSVPAEIVNDDGTAFLRGFRLIGMRSASKTSSAHFYTQIMIANSNTNSKSDSRIYVRSKYGGADNYGPWSKLGYADDFLPFSGNDYNITEIKATEDLGSACHCGRVAPDGKISLDDILTPGAYKSSSATAANTNIIASSAPSEIIANDGTFQVGFSLQVYGNVNNSTIRQVLIASPIANTVTDIRIFYRHRVKPSSTKQTVGFGPWQRVVLSDEFYNIKNGTFNKDYRKGMSRQIGKDAQNITDLNNLTYLNETSTDNTGTYWCAISGNIQYVLNKPTDLKNGFRLFSFMGSRTYSCHQIIIENGTNYIYSRYTYYNTDTHVRIWSDWERSANKSEIEAEATARAEAITAEATARANEDLAIRKESLALKANSAGVIELIKDSQDIINCYCGRVKDEGLINFNEFYIPGNYKSSSTTLANQNIDPNTVPREILKADMTFAYAFRLEVATIIETGYINQTLITAPTSTSESPKIFTRSFKTTATSARPSWERVILAEQFNNLFKDVIHINNIDNSTITQIGVSSIDLNTLIVDGTNNNSGLYFCKKADVSKVSNKPTDVVTDFVMLSVNHHYQNGKSFVYHNMQFLLEHCDTDSTQVRIYYRDYNDTLGFSQWRDIGSKEAIDKLRKETFTLNHETAIGLNKSSSELAYALDEATGLISLNKLNLGNYYSSTSSAASNNILPASVPEAMHKTSGGVTKGFRLTVIRNLKYVDSSTTYATWTQILNANIIRGYTTAPIIYIRTANGSTTPAELTWGVWSKLAYGEELESAFLLDGKATKDLASGDDLNTFVTPGNFNAKTTTISSGILNKPYTSSIPFRLTVMGNINANSTVYQFLSTNYTATGLSEIYFRRTSSINPITWASWDTIASGTALANLKSTIDTDIKPKLANKFDNVAYNSSDHEITLSSNDTNGKSVTVQLTDIGDMDDRKIGYATYSDEEGEDQYYLKLYNKNPGEGGQELQRIKIVGGGGGGGGKTSVVTMTNDSGWVTKAFSADVETIPFKFSWTSYIGTVPTGPGTLQIIVKSNTEIKTYNLSLASQEQVTIDLKNYVTKDSKITLKVIDSQDNYSMMYLTVKLVSASISSTYNQTIVNTTQISVPYTPYGTTTDGVKTVYFKINGSTFTETISGQEEKVPRTKVIDIPSTWQNGVYTMQVYFIMPLAGEAEPIMSNIIYLNCFIDNNTGVITPYIGSTYTPDSTTNQYDTVTIPYFVYKRGASETNVLLRYKKGTESSWTTFGTVSAPFSEQKWNFTFMTLENDTTTPYTLSICAMEGTTVKAEKQFVFSVKKSTVTIKVHDADRPVYLSAAGRSNNEAAEVRNTWVDEKTGVTSTITNVQWGSYDGWLTSSYDSTIPAKETVLRLMNGGSCVVNYAPFLADNFDLDKGICFEIKLRAKDIKELSTPFLTVWSSDTQRDYGIKIKPEDIIHTGSDKIKASAKYKENEFTTITIQIHRWSTEQPDAEHMVYIYLNGILSFVREYSTNEKFFHQVGGLLEIGGTDDCTVDISRIRIYNTTLTDDQILNNYLCDISDSSLIVDNASRNNIMNNGEPDLDSIKQRMPCMILYTSQEFDKDKTKMNYKMEYYDPDNTQKNFFIDYDEEGYSNKKHNVATQGTSSAEYPLRNFKFLFRKILVGPEAAEGKGTQQTSYKLFDDVPTSNIFTVKVNFASSEQCNNTVISQLFNDACAWKFPKQDYRSDLRFGIKGKPIAIFRQLAGESKPTFYSLGQFNLDKGSYKDIGADVFGFSKIYGTKGSSTPYSDTIWYDEGGWCIEISNNADAALFKKTYDELYEGYDEQGKWQCEAGDAFEYRYRYDGLEAITKKEQLPEIFKNALTAIANAGKMAEGTAQKNAIINAVHTYFERDSLLYYFNFNNFTMGTDQLAKNAMMAYHGGFKRKKNDDPTAEGWIERDPTKIFMMIYDSDTCLGINNQGQYYEGPSYSYELGDSEIVEQGTGKAVWSATNSVLFKLIKKYMEDDYVYNNVEYKGYGSMYADMRKYNPKSLPNPYMSYEYLDTQFSSMQNKWPERLWNYQMRKAYINTYLALGTEALQQLMGTKEQQRRFFLNRRIIYLDSRYHTGESSQATIYFRANAKESSTNDISADARIKLKYNQYLTGSVKWLDTAASGSYTNKKVTDTTQVYEFACPVNVPENANIYVQSANKLTYAAGFGDYCPDSVSLSQCENLRYFSIRPLLEDSDGTPHVNPTAWKSISMGSDIHPLTQLEEVDLSNNTGLALNINLSYAPNIRKVNCENTKVPNVQLIAGAPITHLHLSPETTTIVLEKLNKLTNLTIDVAENSKKVTTIKLDEIPTTLFDIDTFYSQGKCAQNRTCTLVYKLATYGSSSTSVSAVKTYFTNLATKFCGPSGTGNPEVHIKDLYVSQYTDADKQALKDLGVSVTNWHGTYSFTVHFVSEDGTTEYAHYDCTGPTTVTYNKATPTKEPTATQQFTFKSWLREDGSEVTAVTFKRRCTETEYIKAQFTGTDRLYTVYLNNITV